VNVYRCPPFCTGCSICMPESEPTESDLLAADERASEAFVAEAASMATLQAGPEADTFDEACEALDAKCAADRDATIAAMEREAASTVAA
jgi:hypothetical protein